MQNGKRILIITLFLCGAVRGMAQLDSIHWLPPMHAKSEVGPQFLYLSTPEITPFTVYIEDGAGNPITTAEISNSQPFRYDVGATSDTRIVVPETDLHKAIQGRGMVLRGAKPFFATFRAHASSERHADALTCKGRAALGKTFRIGHLIQEGFHDDVRSNFIGVLATEDNTVVVLSGYNPGVRFHSNGADILTTTPVTVALQKGESVVFSNYVFEDVTYQPPNGLIGALLESNKPIAVNCGSWLGSPSTFQGHDIGIDQIVPIELVGTEYILCKGNGSEVLEHPIIVAHTGDTKVYINGSPGPVVILSAGQYYEVPTYDFSAAGNMYVQTNNPVYMYQMIGGVPNTDDQYRTAGLMFVPPVSCRIPNSVDNIYQPNRIGNMRFQGGVMIVAMRDSQVVVRVDGVVADIGAPGDVLGNHDFVTYRKLDLFSIDTTVNAISINAHGAVQVAMYGRNQPASFAAFFSGFTKTAAPHLQLTHIGDGICPDTLSASGVFDGVKWTIDGQSLSFGSDTFKIVYTPGVYIATGYLGVCYRTDYAADTAAISFTSPAFPYSMAGPSCFGFSDGKIDIGTPDGGIAPYQYSVDNGQHFQPSNTFNTLAAGDYLLEVRDSIGCYNHPLEVHITQPDSFGVAIKPIQIPDPLHAGDAVVLQGYPDRATTKANWYPVTEDGCLDCLHYEIRPQDNTWVTLTVYDTAGCPATDRILLEVTPFIYAPNIFLGQSGEGVNSVFNLFSKEDVLVRYMAIFDRWGDQVFENSLFWTNNTSEGWDGLVHGRPGLPGVYVFYAEVELLPGKLTVVKGEVMLAD